MWYVCDLLDAVWYVCNLLDAVWYVRVNCFVVREYAVSRRYIHVCNSDVFSVVNVCFLLHGYVIFFVYFFFLSLKLYYITNGMLV